MKICYFGNYNPEEGRNRIYLKGLKQTGNLIIECRTDKKGIGKYLDLIRKHSRIKNEYDVLVVGYPGHVLVPLAKLISRKKVIFDALCTMWEGVIISRRYYSRLSPAAWRIYLIDWLAVICADLILVESDAQKKFFLKRFWIKKNKIATIYTGADDSVFYPKNIPVRSVFTVLFRGKFLPEAGVTHIIRAAKLLEKDGIDFLILGLGYLEDEVKKEVAEVGPTNLKMILGHLPTEEMRDLMLSCHVSLGQLESHERLERTIPHKAFEALALGMPYITAKSGGVSEILSDGENCLMVRPADPEDLAKAVTRLKNDFALRKRIAATGYDLFQRKLTPKKLASEILVAIRTL